MGALWYWIVAVMLAMYVVFDGFDLGVGILLPFVARRDEERQQALRSVGPVWDGNEVWLLAGGGTLFFAFPLVYASSFSGFYMPLMIVLWLLMLRGLSIELRSHFEDPLWKTFFDGMLVLSSVLLAIFFGAALANVIRGVSLGTDNYFYLPLWTNWRTGSFPGILDWYTVLGGVVALLALALHGALYLCLKTEGELARRSRAAAGLLSGDGACDSCHGAGATGLVAQLLLASGGVSFAGLRGAEPGGDCGCPAQARGADSVSSVLPLSHRDVVRRCGRTVPGAAALDQSRCAVDYDR